MDGRSELSLNFDFTLTRNCDSSSVLRANAASTQQHGEEGDGLYEEVSRKGAKSQRKAGPKAYFAPLRLCGKLPHEICSGLRSRCTCQYHAEVPDSNTS